MRNFTLFSILAQNVVDFRFRNSVRGHSTNFRRSATIFAYYSRVYKQYSFVIMRCRIIVEKTRGAGERHHQTFSSRATFRATSPRRRRLVYKRGVMLRYGGACAWCGHGDGAATCVRLMTLVVRFFRSCHAMSNAHSLALKVIVLISIMKTKSMITVNNMDRIIQTDESTYIDELHTFILTNNVKMLQP